MILRTVIVVVIAAALAGAAVVAAPADAPKAPAAVMTPDGLVEGAVTLTDGAVTVAGKNVPWDSVLYFWRQQDGQTLRSPQAVWLADGEVWHGRVLAMNQGKVDLSLDLLGKRQVDLKDLAAIDFVASGPPASPGKSPALQRQKGETVPGSLVWIDTTRLAIDSPLGVLTLNRDDLVRYVSAGVIVAPGAEKVDEVTLTDGSVLCGQATPAAGALKLKHAILGELTLPAANVRSVLRHRADVAYLAEAAPSEVQVYGLLDATPTAGTDVDRATDQRGGTAWMIKGLSVAPKQTIKYDLGGTTARRVFRCGVATAEDTRGAVIVRVAAGGKTLAEKTVSPGEPAAMLTAELGDATEVTLEVNYAAKMQFPARALIADAHVVTLGKPAAPAASQPSE